MRTESADEPVITNPDTEVNDPEEEYNEPEPLSDEIRPIYTENKSWVCRSVYAPGYEVFSKTWTAICIPNGKFDGYDTWYTCNPGEIYVYYDPECVREENGSVYIHMDDYDRETATSHWEFKILYSINPVAEITDHYKNLIQSRGTIVVEGKTRRALRVINSHTKYDYWVEGIGPIRGTSINYGPIPSCPPGMVRDCPLYVEIVECYEGEEKIFDINNFSDDLYIEEEEFFPME